jgi:uncharacterized membrane protein
MDTEKKETSRVEAFSDGVFAIALTLLILEVIASFKPHEGDKDPSYFVMIQTNWQVLAAFLISFVTIGIMWINHHRLFTLITHVDHTLLILNLWLLLMVTVVPFPTALLGEAKIGTPLFREATFIYGGAFFLTALPFNALWRYATYRSRLLGRDADMQVVNRISRQYLFGPLLYLLAFVLSWWFPEVSLGLQGLLAAFFLLPGVELKKSKREQNTNGETSPPLQEQPNL